MARAGPDDLLRHKSRLDLAIGCISAETSGLAATGQQNDRGGSQLGPEDDWLTTPKVAAIVKCSARTAQRLAKRELGQFMGGRWLCRRSIVEKYTKEQIR